MRKLDVSDEEELGLLEDKTEALALRSKRTERVRKKQAKKGKKTIHPSEYLTNLPYELMFAILSLLRPSDIFNLQRVNRAFHSFITQQERELARAITSWRYVCLSQCFRLPVLMENIDPSIRVHIQNPERGELRWLRKKPYQHIQTPDPAEICTCLTCLLRWSGLCLIVDFAHWQRNLDTGDPIPMIPRGGQPQWNQTLIASNAAIARKAFRSPLWHARLLEAHLDSTTRSIRRHAANKGNKKSRFHMTKEDMEAGTDLFLERSGPPSNDIPFHRDNYYMLEAYVPNRAWFKHLNQWQYLPASEHDRDVAYIVFWATKQLGTTAAPGPGSESGSGSRLVSGS